MLLYHRVDFIGNVRLGKGVGTFAYFIAVKAEKVSESRVASLQKGPGIPGSSGCNTGSPFYSLCSIISETKVLLPQVYFSVLLILCWIRPLVLLSQER